MNKTNGHILNRNEGLILREKPKYQIKFKLRYTSAPTIMPIVYRSEESYTIVLPLLSHTFKIPKASSASTPLLSNTPFSYNTNTIEAINQSS